MSIETNNYECIDAFESDYLYVVTSQIPNAGKGLRTAIKIYKGEVISFFYGEILSNKEIEIRVNKNIDQYFINMVDGTIMDSKDTDCFAKYSNDALANIDKVSLLKNNSKIGLNENNKVCLIATRNIKSNEEIFCSYGKKYWKKHAVIK